MTELQAISIIETELDKTLNGYKIKVISREFYAFSEYSAQIVVIMKDEELLPQTLEDLYNKLKNDSITEIEIKSTNKDLKELDFEILSLEANITIGE